MLSQLAKRQHYRLIAYLSGAPSHSQSLLKVRSVSSPSVAPCLEVLCIFSPMMPITLRHVLDYSKKSLRPFSYWKSNPPPLVFYFSLASGISSPSSTPPTQSVKQPPAFLLEAYRSEPERPEARMRSYSSPPDTGQRFSLPCTKPPMTPTAPITTSQSQPVSTTPLLKHH